MVTRVQFEPHGSQMIDGLSNEGAYNILFQALELSNKKLNEEGISVVFIEQVSPQALKNPQLLDTQYILLGIQKEGQQKPIDVINLRALDEISIKSQEGLVNEIVNKVRQHIAAEKIKEIIFSSTGSKLDTRLLTTHTVVVDGQGYLTVNQQRIAIKTDQKDYKILEALALRSPTIIRLIEENDKILFLDDYDLVRKDEKGMCIDTSKTEKIASGLLGSKDRHNAKGYSGRYFLLEEYKISKEIADQLRDVLSKIPPP